MPDLDPTILNSAQGPKRVQNAGESAEAHSLPDQIAADKYLKANASLQVNNNPMGIRHVKLRPPSAADVDFCGPGGFR